MSLKYEPVSVEIESCTDLVQLSIPEIESCTDLVQLSRISRVIRRGAHAMYKIKIVLYSDIHSTKFLELSVFPYEIPNHESETPNPKT